MVFIAGKEYGSPQKTWLIAGIIAIAIGFTGLYLSLRKSNN